MWLHCGVVVWWLWWWCTVLLTPGTPAGNMCHLQEALREDDNVFDVAFEGQGDEQQTTVSATDVKVRRNDHACRMLLLLPQAPMCGGRQAGWLERPMVCAETIVNWKPLGSSCCFQCHLVPRNSPRLLPSAHRAGAPHRLPAGSRGASSPDFYLLSMPPLFLRASATCSLPIISSGSDRSTRKYLCPCACVFVCLCVCACVRACGRSSTSQSVPRASCF